jgi:hypothetical protein
MLSEEELGLVVIAAIFSAVYVVTVPLYVWRRNWEPIKSRGSELSMALVTYAALDLSLRTAANVSLIPCWLEQIRAVLSLPVWIYPYFVRAHIIWFVIQSSFLSFPFLFLFFENEFRNVTEPPFLDGPSQVQF